MTYVPVQDNKAMLDAAGRLVFLITAGLAVVSVLAGWLIAGSTGKQLDRLCRHMLLIGKKDFSLLEQDFSIKELDKLKASINDMTGKLSKADKAKEDFFQNVSHELRTPLMSISGYAQGIEQGIFADPKNAAAIIASESHRLKELVDGILTISKLDNDNVPLQLCTICLNDFVSESLEQLGGINMLSGITASFHNPDEEIMIIADAALLSQSFQNVISNCIRYASSQINIEIFREEGHICLTVEDDGPGIGEEELPHLFERFYKGKKGKFGIGLSIAKASMEYMGGSICAGNGEYGASFTLILAEQK